jgi:hypothetical protein
MRQPVSSRVELKKLRRYYYYQSLVVIQIPLQAEVVHRSILWLTKNCATPPWAEPMDTGSVRRASVCFVSSLIMAAIKRY